MVALSCKPVTWKLRRPFRIAYDEITSIDTLWLVASLPTEGVYGRAEAAGVFYRGETIHDMRASLACLSLDGETAPGPADVQSMLPAGGARNALDCALWDLAAKRQGRRAYSLAGLAAPAPRPCFYTIGLFALTQFETEVRGALERGFDRLKVKLDGRDDLDRLQALRRLAPDATLAVDANQSWTPDHLARALAPFARLGVVMIEQPHARGADLGLSRGTSPIPICADESCETRADLPALVQRYDLINIKLDKTGGLTEALALQRDALAEGLSTMVGNMCGSSLSQAPAFLLAAKAEHVDLDGPLLNTDDCEHAIRYDGSLMHPPAPELWG